MQEPERKAARPSPEWLKRSIMYQLFLRAFTPEGTLAAATAKLPELADLGVDIVYLCPICVQDDDPREEFWSDRQRASGLNNPRNPYRVKDYFAVDPEYGSDADLHEFIGRAHGLGMRVFLDVVYYHCGPTAVFLEEHPDYVKLGSDGKPVAGEWHFPVFNFENPELREYLWGNMEYWVREFAVDGYRCDASDHVPLDFWEEAHRRLERVNPEIILFSESGRPEHQHEAFDLNYSYLFHKAAKAASGEVNPRQSWGHTNRAFPEGAKLARFMDNHDIANDSGAARVETQLGAKGVEAMLAAIFALDGVPMLYNGQEVADEAPHSIYGNLVIDWANGGTSDGMARRIWLKQLSAIRHEERALTDGTVTWLDHDTDATTLTFLRQDGTDRVLVLVNLAATSTAGKLASPCDVTNQPLLVRDASLTGDSFELGPHGYLFIK